MGNCHARITKDRKIDVTMDIDSKETKKFIKPKLEKSTEKVQKDNKQTNDVRI
jgi:hypothetical protein